MLNLHEVCCVIQQRSAFFLVCKDRLAEFVLHFIASFMHTVGPLVGSCLDRKIYLT